jgi:hypothetical protein
VSRCGWVSEGPATTTGVMPLRRSASVTFGSSRAHTFSKSVRALKKFGAVPFSPSPLCDRVEAAAPAPLVDAGGHTRAETDGADVDVAVVDAPRLMASIRITAAGQGGHARMIALTAS